ncbi:MAG TPA: hypothetical protein VJ952_08785 [Opitutales bacterium]|nr:hypothetical protein [Opitutales bacterium]
MKKKKKKIFAHKQPNGDGHQVSYEEGESRKLRHFPRERSAGEPRPHGAGSYHDPEHHHELLERVEAYLKAQS